MSSTTAMFERQAYRLSLRSSARERCREVTQGRIQEATPVHGGPQEGIIVKREGRAKTQDTDEGAKNTAILTFRSPAGDIATRHGAA